METSSLNCYVEGAPFALGDDTEVTCDKTLNHDGKLIETYNLSDNVEYHGDKIDYIKCSDMTECTACIQKLIHGNEMEKKDFDDNDVKANIKMNGLGKVINFDKSDSDNVVIFYEENNTIQKVEFVPDINVAFEMDTSVNSDPDDNYAKLNMVDKNDNTFPFLSESSDSNINDGTQFNSSQKTEISDETYENNCEFSDDRSIIDCASDNSSNVNYNDKVYNKSFFNHLDFEKNYDEEDMTNPNLMPEIMNDFCDKNDGTLYELINDKNLNQSDDDFSSIFGHNRRINSFYDPRSYDLILWNSIVSNESQNNNVCNVDNSLNFTNLIYETGKSCMKPYNCNASRTRLLSNKFVNNVSKVSNNSSLIMLPSYKSDTLKMNKAAQIVSESEQFEESTKVLEGIQCTRDSKNLFRNVDSDLSIRDSSRIGNNFVHGENKNRSEAGYTGECNMYNPYQNGCRENSVEMNPSLSYWIETEKRNEVVNNNSNYASLGMNTVCSENGCMLDAKNYSFKTTGYNNDNTNSISLIFDSILKQQKDFRTNSIHNDQIQILNDIDSINSNGKKILNLDNEAHNHSKIVEDEVFGSTKKPCMHSDFSGLSSTDCGDLQCKIFKNPANDSRKKSLVSWLASYLLPDKTMDRNDFKMKENEKTCYSDKNNRNIHRLVSNNSTLIKHSGNKDDVDSLSDEINCFSDVEKCSDRSSEIPPDSSSGDYMFQKDCTVNVDVQNKTDCDRYNENFSVNLNHIEFKDWIDFARDKQLICESEFNAIDRDYIKIFCDSKNENIIEDLNCTYQMDQKKVSKVDKTVFIGKNYDTQSDSNHGFHSESLLIGENSVKSLNKSSLNDLSYLQVINGVYNQENIYGNKKALINNNYQDIDMHKFSNLYDKPNENFPHDFNNLHSNKLYNHDLFGTPPGNMKMSDLVKEFEELIRDKSGKNVPIDTLSAILRGFTDQNTGSGLMHKVQNRDAYTCITTNPLEPTSLFCNTSSQNHKMQNKCRSYRSKKSNFITKEKGISLLQFLQDNKESESKEMNDFSRKNFDSYDLLDKNKNNLSFVKKFGFDNECFKSGCNILNQNNYNSEKSDGSLMTAKDDNYASEHAYFENSRNNRDNIIHVDNIKEILGNQNSNLDLLLTSGMFLNRDEHNIIIDNQRMTNLSDEQLHGDFGHNELKGSKSDYFDTNIGSIECGIAENSTNKDLLFQCKNNKNLKSERIMELMESDPLIKMINNNASLLKKKKKKGTLLLDSNNILMYGSVNNKENEKNFSNYTPNGAEVRDNIKSSLSAIPLTNEKFKMNCSSFLDHNNHVIMVNEKNLKKNNRMMKQLRQLRNNLKNENTALDNFFSNADSNMTLETKPKSTLTDSTKLSILQNVDFSQDKNSLIKSSISNFKDDEFESDQESLYKQADLAGFKDEWCFAWTKGLLRFMKYVRIAEKIQLCRPVSLNIEEFGRTDEISKCSIKVLKRLRNPYTPRKNQIEQKEYWPRFGVRVQVICGGYLQDMLAWSNCSREDFQLTMPILESAINVFLRKVGGVEKVKNGHNPFFNACRNGFNKNPLMRERFKHVMQMNQFVIPDLN